MSAIFVLNAGSSSLKYQLIEPDTQRSIVSGLIERIGVPGSPVTNHTDAVAQAFAHLEDAGAPSPDACGHRVVHGGDEFDRATIVDAAVEQAIEGLVPLAPLHNPANLAGLRAARTVHPGIPQVAVFDTAFHQTIPDAAASYAIDAELARAHRIRRYGFHGTSHQYVSRRAVELLGIPVADSKIIVLHLGNGASACAVHSGRSIETSMGLTPLEGLVMGTRSGDIDPAVLFHLHRAAGLSIEELESLLTTRSGLAGLAGRSDMRDVHAAAAQGDAQAALALDVVRHRIRRYVGAYTAHLHGLDAVVFTAGVGENDALLRERTMTDLEHFGIVLDLERNRSAARDARRISTDDSPVAVLVIPTNEELEIARQTAEAIA